MNMTLRAEWLATVQQLPRIGDGADTAGLVAEGRAERGVVTTSRQT